MCHGTGVQVSSLLPACGVLESILDVSFAAGAIPEPSC